jgi:hypothetical protein
VTETGGHPARSLRYWAVFSKRGSFLAGFPAGCSGLVQVHGFHSRAYSRIALKLFFGGVEERLSVSNSFRVFPPVIDPVPPQ